MSYQYLKNILSSKYKLALQLIWYYQYDIQFSQITCHGKQTDFLAACVICQIQSVIYVIVFWKIILNTTNRNCDCKMPLQRKTCHMWENFPVLSIRNSLTCLEEWDWGGRQKILTKDL